MAIAYGAATIVNAIALGKGAALGVDLWTKAEVILTDDPTIIKGKIISDLSEDTSLMEKTVARIFQYFDMTDKVGAKIKTWSNIPIARGLKSSSAAANAVSLATLEALNKKSPKESFAARNSKNYTRQLVYNTVLLGRS